MTHPTLTFKKEPKETGLRAISANAPDTQIKRKGKQIGYISSPRREQLFTKPERQWSIHLTVIRESDDHNPAPFKWIHLKSKFDSEEAARNYVRLHNDLLQKKFDLYELGV